MSRSRRTSSRSSKSRSSLTVYKLFKKAKLSHCGPVKWGDHVNDPNRGIYVVARVSKSKASCGRLNIKYLPPSEQKRWLHNQPIIYIGRTKRSLSIRISEYYRHKLGKKSPHRGGEAVKR